MPGRRWTAREMRNPKQRVAIAISKHCAKPKNRRQKVCVIHRRRMRRRRR